ncbi:MAG: hypothetical protein E7407_02855 [Ruminococcaceae bacterium]|nr:hypothetical protein [Oscillospiraceae bacterium]
MTTNNINLEKNQAVKKIKEKKGIGFKTLFYEITEYFLAFFMSKTCILGTLSPFGISYFAATFPSHEMSFGTIAAFSGILFMGMGITSLKYIGALALYLLFMMLYNKDVSQKKWISALAGSLSLFSVGMVFVVSEGFLIYDTLLLCLESILSFLSFFAFDKASNLLRTIKTRKFLEPNEILSLVFLYSALTMSVSSISGLEGAGHILSVCAILIISLSSGFQLSTVTGLILGTVMSLFSVLPSQVICTYTLSALGAGLSRRYGKIGVSFAFIMINSITTIYVNSSSLTIINILFTLSAVLIVLLIPKSWLTHISEILNVNVFPFSYGKENRAIEAITEKLSDASDSFFELSSIFSQMTESAAKSDILSPAAIFDSVFDDVCKNCNMCTYCWYKNYDSTSADISILYNSMTDRGYATEFDAPCQFRAECIKFDDFLESVNKNYEIHKINLAWASKVRESKSIVSQQFENISSVLGSIKKQFQKGLVYDEILETKIRASLDKKGISASFIRVVLTDCYEVTVKVSSCEKDTSYIGLIASTVGACLETPVFPVAKTYLNDECTLKFREKANFSLDAGFAKTSPDGNTKSGDSHAFMPLEDGKYILCLSDGMGHGKEASSQSKTTTELIRKLLLLGFDKEIALKIINTFLLFNSKNETFATADVCVVNLYSGALEFIKSGAVSSFIKTADEVKEIKCSSLPTGAISNLYADCELEYATGGDYIIMTTDGISDVLITEDKNYLKEIIENFDEGSPQELADIIITNALSRTLDKVHDDMTVLVSKISEVM